MKIERTETNTVTHFTLLSEAEIADILARHIAKEVGLPIDNVRIKSDVQCLSRERAGPAGYEWYAKITIIEDRGPLRINGALV